MVESKLRLIDPARKPRRHMGAIRSDVTVNRYEAEYRRMTEKYRIVAESRVSLWRRVWLLLATARNRVLTLLGR